MRRVARPRRRGPREPARSAAPRQPICGPRRSAPTTAPELLIGGPDAIGGVGDWYLANDIVEVIVDDPARRFGKRNHGGVIVDAGLRDRQGEDQFAELFPLLNLDQRVALRFDTIRAEVDPGERWARLVVSSSRGPGVIPRGGWLARRFDLLVPDADAIEGVRVETEYAVFPRRAVGAHHHDDPQRRRASGADLRLRRRADARRPQPARVRREHARARAHARLPPHELRPQQDPRFRRRDGELHVRERAGRRASFRRSRTRCSRPSAAHAGCACFGVTSEHVSVIDAFLADPDWRS